MYDQMDKTYKYLKSIPKKDYEAWLKEVAAFTMSTRDLVELKIVKIYETSKRQAAEAEKFLAKMKTLETGKYKNMAVEQMNKVIFKSCWILYSYTFSEFSDLYVL